MRTSADIGVWWQALDGTTNLVLIEVKFTESEFGHCAKGQKHGGVCDNGGNELVATYGHGCPLQEPPHQRTYWTLIEKHDLFDSDTLSASKACPFRDDGYQLMRNQLLAAVMEDDPDQELGRVDFAILTHDDNPDILALDHTLAGETTAESAWRAVLRRPERFHSWRASDWVTSVRRTSNEEQAVIPWIRRALTSGLRLDEMGDGWIFLNQEWRFLDGDGNGKKSDVLAVHLPSGRLGIVEFKDALSKRSEAVGQVAGYRDFWMRDREVLAGFFTAQLRAMGDLYGNEEAVAAHVRPIEPVLFFGWPDDNGIQVEHLTPGDDL